MNKPNLIVLSGVDKTGKDSLRHELTRLTNGNTYIVCRGFLDVLAYAKLFNRKIDTDFYYEKIKQLHEIGFRIVLLSAPFEELKLRFIKHNEPDIEIEKHLDVFEKEAKIIEEKLGIEILRITTVGNITNIASEILEKI